MEQDIFAGLQLTQEESDFINDIRGGICSVDVRTARAAESQALASMRLAKEIERASNSGDKHAKAMNHLTIALVVVGLLQVAIAVIAYCFQQN